jgi:hypothetical protein
MIVDKLHEPELETRAAVLELGHGVPRHAAELQAHEAYLQHHLKRSAAHHLAGVRSAYSVGDMVAAASHGMMYHVIAKKLGFNPAGEPPADVQAMSTDPQQTPIAEFKPHGADAVILEHLRVSPKPMKKAEDDETPLIGRRSPDGSWDMSHLLPALRRQQGDRLVLKDGPGMMTVHHVRDEAGRVVPLTSFADQDGDVRPMHGQAPEDVRKAASLAVRVRKASDLASLSERVKATAGQIDLARQGSKLPA